MKRFIAFLLIFVLSLTSNPALGVVPSENKKINSSNISENLSPVEAKGAILIWQQNGKILYSKNAYQKLYSASTTKIMTALLAIENGKLDENIIVGNEINVLEGDASKAGLKTGDHITLRNLIFGLMLPSGNDAANTIAVYIARKTDNNSTLDIDKSLHSFASLMNKRAKELGLKNTNFVNAHGYHDVNHYTTTYDLAIIAKKAMEYEFFREVVGTTSYSVNYGQNFDESKANTKDNSLWFNKNLLLFPKSKFYYPGSTGIKTGYTSLSGHCLAASAEKDGIKLVSVVLDSSKEGKWTDTKTLMDYGFNNFEIYKGTKKGYLVKSIKLENANFFNSNEFTAVTKKDFQDILPKSEIPKIKKTLSLDKNLLVPSSKDQGKMKLLKPIKKGQLVGKLTYSLNEETIGETNIIADRSINKHIINIAVPQNISSHLYWYAGILGFFILMLLIKRHFKLNKRRRIFKRRKY